MRRVLIVGSSRSGTTLMHSALSVSGCFADYKAESLLLNVCRPKYGDLDRGESRERFLHDWFRSRQFVRSGLSARTFTRLLDQCGGSYARLLALFMDEIAIGQDKPGWIESTPDNVFFLSELQQVISDLKVIHLIRDGRSVAASRRRLGWTVTNVKGPLAKLLYAGAAWELSIEAGREFRNRFPETYLEVKYENLITQIEHEVQRLNNFLGIELTTEKLIASKFGALGHANTAFGEAMSGLSREGLNRWRQVLSEVEQIRLTDFLSSTLSELGYIEPVPCSFHSIVTRSVVRTHIRAKRFFKYRTSMGKWGTAHLEFES